MVSAFLYPIYANPVPQEPYNYGESILNQPGTFRRINILDRKTNLSYIAKNRKNTQGVKIYRFTFQVSKAGDNHI